METDPPRPPGPTGESTGKRDFSLDAAPPPVPDTTGAEGQAVLMWLAGAGYDPKGEARRRGMVPLSKGVEETADRLLQTMPPDDSLSAARLRAEILRSLYRDAYDDPRVLDIFDADPIIIADPRTGWLVTGSMLEARLALFDALHTMLDKPLLDRDARIDMGRTLAAAFLDLSPDSQREWCHSELRLEQGVALLESRSPSELMELADTLRPVFNRRGSWDALRLFSIAAAMNDIREGKVVPVADLLMLDE